MGRGRAWRSTPTSDRNGVESCPPRPVLLLSCKQVEPARRQRFNPKAELHPTRDRGAKRTHLFVFQMSLASFQSRPILRHTTTCLPTISCGGWAFVFSVTVPTSRAAVRLSGSTSRVVSLASLSCPTAPFQNASMAARPLTISARGRKRTGDLGSIVAPRYTPCFLRKSAPCRRPGIR